MIFRNPATIFWLVCTMLFGYTVAWGQGANPHLRSMERAQPTPDAMYFRDVAPKVPFLQSTSNTSRFQNSNMIIEESDALPVQNESSIAVNPRNPNNLIGSAVDYRGSNATWVYVSTDGGIVWNNITLGKARAGWTSSNDPSVCFDHTGTGYLCYGGFNRTGNMQFGENGVFVSVTTDGGQTWDPKHVAVIIHTGQQTADSSFEDKYYIHADTATGSPYRGRIYIPWKRVINRDSSTGIVLTHSTDKGRTWSVPVAVGNRFPGTSEDTTFGQSFPLARTSPNGDVHIVWNSGTESSVRYGRSTDGGNTFTTPRIIHKYNPFGVKSTINNQSNSRVKKVVRAEAYPSLTIDNTTGSRRGWLYLVWSADATPNIYFSRSTDNGETWSASKILHSVETNDQFWPWIALDPTNGELAVMYFDSRDDSANILVNCYVSYSNDGGTTWVDRRVGDGDNDLRRNPFTGNTFAGDYSGCDFYDGKIYPSWVDMRHTTSTNFTDNDVYTSVIPVRAPAAVDWLKASPIADEPTSIALSWTEVTETSFGKPLAATDANYLLMREGTLIATLPLNVTQYKDDGLIVHQLYKYTLRVASTKDTSATRYAEAWAGGSRLPAAPVIESVKGAEQANISCTVKLPTYRADSSTKLVNMQKIEFRFGSYSEEISVAASDTGKILPFDLKGRADGWFWLSAKVIDANGNSSAYSDSVMFFTGNTMWNVEKFDSLPNFAVLSGKWSTTNHFAYSQPNSYTESPIGNYPPSRRDSVLLYPHTSGTTAGNQTLMSWRVAAFVDPSDSASIEYSVNGIAGPWQLIKSYNWLKDDRWMDTTKGEDAWRYEYFQFPNNGQLVHLRLKFYSNVTKQSDGFYIDDIAFSDVTSVEESEVGVVGMYPQPASDVLTVGIRNADLLLGAVVVNARGLMVEDLNWALSGSTVVLDTKNLESGIYSLQLTTSAGLITKSFLVLR